MRKSDYNIWFMQLIFVLYYILHNMCTISKDKLNKELIKKNCKKLNYIDISLSILKYTDNSLSIELREIQKMRVEMTTIGKIRNIMNTKNNLGRC